MKMIIPPALRSYTHECAEVEAAGQTLTESLADLDQRYPGIRFRIIDEQDGIREHIKIFINLDQANSLGASLREDDKVLIVCALSGG